MEFPAYNRRTANSLIEENLSIITFSQRWSIISFASIIFCVISGNLSFNLEMYCGTFNFAAIGRIRTLVNMVYNDKNERLDLPIKEFMIESYSFSDLGVTTKNDFNNFIKDFTIRYANRASTDTIKINFAAMTMDDMVEKFEAIFKCLVKCGRVNRQGKFTMERVELLWPERTSMDETISDMIDNSFLSEFLGSKEN